MVAVLVVLFLLGSLLDFVFVLHLCILVAVLVVVDPRGFHMMAELS